MSKIIERPIYLEKSGVWWAYSFTKPDRVFSLHTKDQAKAQAKYDTMLASLRDGEARYRALKAQNRQKP